MKVKVIFQGKDYVVVKLREDVSVHDLVKKGIFIQRDGVLYDRKGRRVIISSTDFFHGNKPYLTGTCGGSVFEIAENVVSTAGHVMQCVDRLVINNRSYGFVDSYIVMPRQFPSWLWDVMLFFGYKPYSSFDFAAAIVKGSVSDYNTGRPYPRAIYVAGNCVSKQQRNCLGIALGLPFDDDPASTLRQLVGVKLRLDCTYHNYDTTAVGVDVGESFVNYGRGYALLYPSLLMVFDDVPGIPGCSGSMVFPNI